MVSRSLSAEAQEAEDLRLAELYKKQAQLEASLTMGVAQQEKGIKRKKESKSKEDKKKKKMKTFFSDENLSLSPPPKLASPLRATPIQSVPAPSEPPFNCYCPRWFLSLDSSILTDAGTAEEAADHVIHDLPIDKHNIENMSLEQLKSCCLHGLMQGVGFSSEAFSRAAKFEQNMKNEMLKAARAEEDRWKAIADLEALREENSSLREELKKEQEYHKADMAASQNSISKLHNELLHSKEEAVKAYKESEQFDRDSEFKNIYLMDAGFRMALRKIKLRYPNLDTLGLTLEEPDDKVRGMPTSSSSSSEEQTKETAGDEGDEDNEDDYYEVQVIEKCPSKHPPAAPTTKTQTSPAPPLMKERVAAPVPQPALNTPCGDRSTPPAARVQRCSLGVEFREPQPVKLSKEAATAVKGKGKEVRTSPIFV